MNVHSLAAMTKKQPAAADPSNPRNYGRQAEGKTILTLTVTDELGHEIIRRAGVKGNAKKNIPATTKWNGNKSALIEAALKGRRKL